MDRTDIAVLVNSTPQYYYILPLFFGMLRRYAPDLKWDVILATEVPEHPVCKKVALEHNVKILPISPKLESFIDSRLAALESIQEKYQYCLMLQDDFILEMPMDATAIRDLLAAMDSDPTVASARLMPCPGPAAADAPWPANPAWKVLSQEHNEYGFVYQATIWRLDAATLWYRTLVTTLESVAPRSSTPASMRRHIEIRQNLAENSAGQQLFWRTLGHIKHVAWIRKGPQPNAVYLSPFPYRPTAIVHGNLEFWAVQLAQREGISFEHNQNN